MQDAHKYIEPLRHPSPEAHPVSYGTVGGQVNDLGSKSGSSWLCKAVIVNTETVCHGMGLGVRINLLYRICEKAFKGGDEFTAGRKPFHPGLRPIADHNGDTIMFIQMNQFFGESLEIISDGGSFLIDSAFRKIMAQNTLPVTFDGIVNAMSVPVADTLGTD